MVAAPAPAQSHTAARSHAPAQPRPRAPPKDGEEVEDATTKALRELYYNVEDPGSYGGVEKLFRSANKAGMQKVTRARMKQFLADQQSYTLHKP